MRNVSWLYPCVIGNLVVRLKVSDYLNVYNFVYNLLTCNPQKTIVYKIININYLYNSLIY